MNEIRGSDCDGLDKILRQMITDERTLQILKGNSLYTIDIDIHTYNRSAKEVH